LTWKIDGSFHRRVSICVRELALQLSVGKHRADRATDEKALKSECLTCITQWAGVWSQRELGVEEPHRTFLDIELTLPFPMSEIEALGGL
jgi:hypothetical protein